MGDHVRALVRPGSRTDFLDALGVEIVRGDLTDPAACATAVAGVELIFHCAAKVGDWGRWHEFQTGLPRRDRDARAGCHARPARAAFFISARPARMGIPRWGQPPIDETAPLGQNVWILDYYTRSKVECERLLWRMAEREGFR